MDAVKTCFSSSTGSRVSTGTKDLQFQGNLKGGEYKRKISGAGDKSPMGAITGSRGKGNKALRRSGQGYHEQAKQCMLEVTKMK